MNIKSLIVSFSIFISTLSVAGSLYAESDLKSASLKLETPANSDISEIHKTIIKEVEKELNGLVLNTKNIIKKQNAKLDNLEAADEAEVRNSLVQLKTNDFVINNLELVKHWGFSSELDQVARVNFWEVASADQDKESQNKTQEDLVTTKQSSPAKPDMDDDLVMFDYSDKKTSSPFEKASMSQTVKNAIEREISRDTKTKFKKIDFQKEMSPVLVASNTIEEKVEDLLKDNSDAIIYDYTKKKAEKKESIAEMLNKAMKKDQQKMEMNVDFLLKAFEVNLKTQRAKDLSGFEFVPDFDRSQRVSDSNTGDLKISYPINDKKAAILTGVVQAHGLIPTRVDINLLETKKYIPLFNEEGIQKFLEKEALEIRGNLILAEISKIVKDVEVDSSYQAKIYLSSKFKVVNSREEARYVLFLGTQVGNTLMKYLLTNNESASKIVYVGEGEMFFDASQFVSSKRDQFSFMTRSLLGKSVKELNIDPEYISVFGSQNKSKKKTINTYEFKMPMMSLGERTYLEFKHLGYSLFLGTKSQNYIEVPSHDFIKKVMEINNLSHIGERCLVQINLTEELRNITISGKNKLGEMFVETTFLDQDGNFSIDSSELAEKVFVTGDQEGMFNAKVEYADGSVHFLKSFCSAGAFIVEQL